MKTLFVNQLSVSTQKEIEKDLINALNELELSQEELSEALANTMSSRLSDLQDTININKYL